MAASAYLQSLPDKTRIVKHHYNADDAPVLELDEADYNPPEEDEPPENQLQATTVHIGTSPK